MYFFFAVPTSDWRQSSHIRCGRWPYRSKGSGDRRCYATLYLPLWKSQEDCYCTYTSKCIFFSFWRWHCYVRLYIWVLLMSAFSVFEYSLLCSLNIRPRTLFITLRFWRNFSIAQVIWHAVATYLWFFSNKQCSNQLEAPCRKNSWMQVHYC